MGRLISILSVFSGFSYKNGFALILLAVIFIGVAYALGTVFSDSPYELSEIGISYRPLPVLFSSVTSLISLFLIVTSVIFIIIGTGNIVSMGADDYKENIAETSEKITHDMVGEDVLKAASDVSEEFWSLSGSNEVFNTADSIKKQSVKQTNQFKRDLKKAADMIDY